MTYPQIPQSNVYIVSLTDQDERRNELKNIGFDDGWVNNYKKAYDLRQVDTKNLSHIYDESIAIKRYYRKLRSAEIGCAISHREIYESMIEQNQRIALILEDDAYPVGEKFREKIEEIVYLLDPLIKSNSSFICHLGINPDELVQKRQVYQWRKNKLSDVNLNLLIPVFSSIWTTHGYLISLAGAKKILNNEKKVCYVADDWQIRQQNNTLEYVFFSELIFKQNDKFETTVQSNSQSWGMAPEKHLIYRLIYKPWYLLKRFYSSFLSKIPFILVKE